jgi:hypothetical protein
VPDRPTCKEPPLDGSEGVCGKPVKTIASGLCMTHYQRIRRQNLKLGTETGADVPRVKTRPSSHYSTIDIESALLAVVMNGGVVRKAAEITGIPAATISKWVNNEFNQRYSELRAEKGPELEKLAVEGLLSFVHRAEAVKAVALDKTLAELEAGDTKDPGATLRNIATAQGISVTKIMELSGRPTSVVVHRPPNELLARLASLGAIVDGSATEIPAATLVETNPSVAPKDGDSTQEVGN